MKPKISLITLGVSDFARSVSFYRDGLGFPLAQLQDDVAFFQLEGVTLSLYPREKLAEDAQVPSEGTGFKGFTLAHNVKTKEEVRAVLDIARAAGASIQKEAEEVFWGGYSGYFTDPDGFLIEVAYNPFMDLT
jgi:catechol 2,3-dioxygenase-like lactoylglutathione lyase family enzyme